MQATIGSNSWTLDTYSRSAYPIKEINKKNFFSFTLFQKKKKTVKMKRKHSLLRSSPYPLSTCCLTIYFLPKLLCPYLQQTKQLIFTNKDCYASYYKWFVEHTTWRASHVAPKKALTFVTILYLDYQTKWYDTSPITHMYSNRNKFVFKPYCTSSLTSLELAQPLKDYSALQQCTQLTKLAVHLGQHFTNLVFPTSIIDLEIRGIYRSQGPDTFPPHLTSLTWDLDQSLNVNALPSSLTSLKGPFIGWHIILPPSLLFFEQRHNTSEFTLTHLPPNLSHLHFTYTTYHPPVPFFDSFPSSLTYLSMNGSFDNINIHLPPQLVELHLGNSFNHLISFPSTLKKLTLGRDFSQKLDLLSIPLEELTLGELFHHPLDQLPNSLTTFVAKCSSYFLPLRHLPHSIEVMELTSNMISQMVVWPSNVKKVHLMDTNHVFDIIPPNALVIVDQCTNIPYPKMRCKQCLHQSQPCLLK